MKSMLLTVYPTIEIARPKRRSVGTAKFISSIVCKHVMCILYCTFQNVNDWLIDWLTDWQNYNLDSCIIVFNFVSMQLIPGYEQCTVFIANFHL